MKKTIAFSLFLSALFLSFQLLDQVDPKTNENQQKAPANVKMPAPSVKTSQDSNTNPDAKTRKEPSKEKSKSSGSIIYDRLGEKMATVGTDGTIRDIKGNTLGRYSSKGEYFGPTGEKAGTIQDGVIRNNNGVEIGRIGKDGKVNNAKGKLLGTIYDDGPVRNSKGSRLGSAPGVDKNISALVFFYKKKSSSGEKKQQKQSTPDFKSNPAEKK